jgi:hypothetical protein
MAKARTPQEALAHLDSLQTARLRRDRTGPQSG